MRRGARVVAEAWQAVGRHLGRGVLAGFLSLFVVWAPMAEAQRLGPEPKRKRGTFVADSNDARALYDWGLQQVERDPGSAADAFYWSARLNPAYAEPLYGRRSALLLANQGLLSRAMNRGRRSPPRELRQLDSLVLRALALNPFLYRRLDRAILVTYIRNESVRGASTSDAAVSDPGLLNFAIERYLREAGPEMRGWLAYSEGDFSTALALYGEVERSRKEKADPRIDRGRIFGMRGDADSAVGQFQAALAELRAKEDKDLVYIYNSKAMLEHSIATLLETRNDADGAREAYGRALQEDLAFFPSHVRLGLLLLSRGDTAAAMSELETAAQVAPDEPWVRFTLGYALAATGQVDRAIEELTKATQLEPLYALPHAILGRIWERKADAAKAIAAYEAFLARAAMTDLQRADVTQRLAEVRAFIRPS